MTLLPCLNDNLILLLLYIFNRTFLKVLVVNRVREEDATDGSNGASPTSHDVTKDDLLLIV